MKSIISEKINTAAVLTILFTFLAGCAPESKNLSSYQSSAANESNHIVGGAKGTADYQQQNGIVGLLIVTKNELGEQSMSICTGTLIAKNIVLTAAHCVANPRITKIAAVFKTDAETATKADLRFGQTSMIHPGYNPIKRSNGSNDDIALVKLQSDAPANFKFANLPNSINSVDLLLNTKVTLAGYGVTNSIVNKSVIDKNGHEDIIPLKSVGSGTLRKVDNIPIVAISPDKKEILLQQSKSRGACHGDSGGPAFTHLMNGTAIQVGLTSRATNLLGNCNEGAIYTSVAAYLPWINATAAKLQAVSLTTTAAVK